MKNSASPCIAVLGAGSWGTALAVLLAKKYKLVRLWGNNPSHIADMQQARRNLRYLPHCQLPESLELHEQLDTALEDATTTVIAVPCHAFRSICEMIVPYVKKASILISATKGLEPNTGHFLSTIVHDVFGNRVIPAVLSGPSFAKEVAAQKPTSVTLACENESIALEICELFSNSYFRVYHNSDLIGVQLGGAVKNVIAIGAGVAMGLNYGVNASAALITRGLAEMLRLGRAVGGNEQTLIGLAGLGDLVLTCSDMQSRNFRFGSLIGRGQRIEKALATIDQVVEGVATTAEIHRLSTAQNIDMPICQQVYEILFHGKSAAQASETLMTRSLKTEY